MERTNRVFLVGPGALKFAKAHGFVGGEPPDRAEPEDLALLEGEALRPRRLDRARRRGREGSRHPLVHREVRRVEDFRPQGTINCNAVTTGRRHRRDDDDVRPLLQDPRTPRRLPVIGAGSTWTARSARAARPAGAKGTSAPAGRTPSSSSCARACRREQAALKTLRADLGARAKENHDAQGRLKTGFNVNFYAVNKRGELAGASSGPASYAKSGQLQARALCRRRRLGRAA